MGLIKTGAIVSYVPKPHKTVFLVSNLHNTDTIDESTGDDQKPEIITFYNYTKAAVDVIDQMCAHYNVARNTKRWPLVIFFAILNVCGINSYIILAGNLQKAQNRRNFIKQLVI